jgi:hypothetical protein
VGQGFVPAAELPLGAVRGQMKAYPSEVAPLLPRHAGQKAGGAIELKSAAHAMAELNYSWSGCAKSPPSTPDPTRPGGGNQQTGRLLRNQHASDAVPGVSGTGVLRWPRRDRSRSKSIVGVRLKQSGMFWTFWTVRGANAIVALRCCRFNHRFEDFRAETRAA